MAKKIISIVLTLCVLMSCVAIGSFSTQAATSSSGVDYGLVDNPQYGNILHCWNWSYNNIKSNLRRIADQGFSTIQTSPAQLLKESVNEYYTTYEKVWWVFYQPIGFTIEDSRKGLGTKAELQALCEEAHKYNIKVIVDVIFNHLANDYGTAGTIHPDVEDGLKNNSNCWHSNLGWQISNYSNRYDVTHYSLNGLPDLNTGDSTVQWYASSYLKELIYLGVDGFRFDAAKHIETPSDAYGTGSEFWYNVLTEATNYAQSTRGFTPYYYGEILDGLQNLGIDAYTYYMSVTDSDGSRVIRQGVLDGSSSSAALSTPCNGAAPDKTVLWVESHDNYAADSNYTRTIDDWYIKKAWALVGSKNQTTGLYLARPNNWSETMIGDADVTAWASSEVQAVNQFKNYFAGQSEYLAAYGSIAYNVRGNAGAVLVDVGGNCNNFVSVPSNGMSAGTYKDQISGNTFTVSEDGWLYGQMGSSGIAVVYNKGPQVSVAPATTAYRTDSLTITLHCAEASNGEYSLDGTNWTKFQDGDQITVGAGTSVGSTVAVNVRSVNMWGTYSNTETYYYWKLDSNESIKVFFDNSMYGWPYTYAYIYDRETGAEAAAWPGIQLSYDDNSDYSYLEVPVGFECAYVIFNNNSDQQTPVNNWGYKLNGETVMFTNEDLVPYEALTTEGLSGDLYFKSNCWGTDADLYAYAWTGGTSTMAKLESVGNNLYKAALGSGTYKRMKILRVDPSATTDTVWSYVWNQSEAQMIPTGCNLFTMADGSWDGTGTWSAYAGSSTSTTATTAATTATTAPTTATTAATTATTAPTTATTAATTASTAATTEATEVTTTASNYFLAGSFNGWGETANPLTVSGTTATTTVTLDAGTYEFKIIDNGTWYGYNSTVSDSTSTSGITMKTSANNATLTATGGTYTFKYNTSTKKLSVSYTPAETEQTEATTAPISTNYYLAGTFNSWSDSATPMAVSDSIATTTMNLSAGTYQFKIIDNGSWYGNNGSIINTTTVTSSVGWKMSASAGNCTLEASGGSYTFSYNTSTKMLVITYSTSTSGDYNSGYEIGDTTQTDPSSTDSVVVAPTDAECEHSYDEGKVTKAATYTAEGEMTHTCTICGETKTEAVDKLKLNKPSVTIKAGKKKITVKYKKVTDATGFQVRYKVKGKFVTKTYNTKKAVTKVIKNLKKGSYKVQVRAMVKQNGVKAYSNWTKVKTVKVK